MEGRRSSGHKVGERCMKCRESPAVLIIRVGDAFCRSCFREYFVHKFRAALGKNRVVFPGEKVLLAYSGGPSSSALIQQVQEGRSRDAPKKLRFVPAVLFIDEGAVCGRSWEERERDVSEVENILKGTSLPYHILYMEQVFSLPGSVLRTNLPQQDGNYKQAVGSFMEQQRTQAGDGISSPAVAPNPTADIPLAEYSRSPTFSRPPAEHTAALRDVFTSIRTLTARQELLHSLRNHLILHVARSRGFSKVMSGESCTRLAVRLLSNISLGRGAFLPLDTGFSDHRFGDVVVVRPMREYSLKEISFYNRLFDVPSVFIPSLDTKAPQSIQNLSESFITKLQADFPSTVSTLYRTSEKLHPSRTDPRREQMGEERCVLCMCTLDTPTGPSSAFSATQLSQRLSEKKSPGCVLPAKDSGKSCCGRGKCSKEITSHSITDTPDLVPLLCYSCRLTIKDLNSVEKLPAYILQEGELRSRRLNIRKSIEEFLLDDDPGDISHPAVSQPLL